MSPLSPKGELISDRYRIEDRLGSGGMSSVFRATDTIHPAVASAATHAIARIAGGRPGRNATTPRPT